jgi:hypothetical protein
MPRTKGARGIKGWVEHELLRALALGEESVEELAEKFDVPPNTIHHFNLRNKHRIAAVLANWSDEFLDLWAVKKHARIADLIYLAKTLQQRMDELEEDAERATETVRRIEPTAAPVRVPTREWRGLVKDKAQLLAQICDEMGQNAAHIGALFGDGGGLSTRRWLLGLEANGHVKRRAKVLRGEDPGPTAEERERQRREESQARTEAMMQRLMASIRPSSPGDREYDVAIQSEESSGSPSFSA